MKEVTKEKVFGVLSVPPNAKTITILSHGFASSKESQFYKDLEQELNRLGIGTLRYDYYAHGERPEKIEDFTLTQAVKTLEDAIAYTRSKGKYDIALLGSSFGGVLSLVVASNDPDIKFLVLKSPVTELKSFWKKRVGEQGLRKWKQEGILHYDALGEKYDLKYGFWEDFQSYDTLDLATKINCPTFIIHGASDSVVPIKQSRDLAKILGTKVKVIEGAGHGYNGPGQYQQMKQEIIDFLAKTVETP